MAKTAPKGKPAKLTRAERKKARAERWQSRRETWRNIRQAFAMTRRNDKRLIPYLVIAGVLTATVVYVAWLLITGSPYLGIPAAIVLALPVMLIIFTRRAQSSMYAQAQGQPGSAAWVLQNQIRGDWRTTPAVAGNAHLDAVHRIIGRPGVVLVGEGAPHRVRGLIAQEKKKVARLAGDTPIYDVIVGTDADEVPLRRLNSYLVKLPRNLSKPEVAALEKRLAALSAARVPLPQGPMPQGAKLRNVQRTVRRRG
jgi:hypothetical protein